MCAAQEALQTTIWSCRMTHPGCVTLSLRVSGAAGTVDSYTRSDFLGACLDGLHRHRIRTLYMPRMGQEFMTGAVTRKTGRPSSSSTGTAVQQPASAGCQVTARGELVGFTIIVCTLRAAGRNLALAGCRVARRELAAFIFVRPPSGSRLRLSVGRRRTGSRLHRHHCLHSAGCRSAASFGWVSSISELGERWDAPRALCAPSVHFSLFGHTGRVARASFMFNEALEQNTSTKSQK